MPKKDWGSPDSQSVTLYGKRTDDNNLSYPVLVNTAGSMAVASKIVDNLDIPQGIKFIDGKPRVSAMPYTYDIAEGNIANHRPWSKIGFAPSVGTTEIDIAPWLAGNYVFPTSELTMTIVSASAQDTLTTGSGAWTVTVYYLNANYEEKTKVCNMAGLTPVQIGTDVFRIQNARISTCGAGNSAAGAITIASGGVTYGYISLGKTRMRQCVWTVPTCCTLYITQITFSASNQNPSKPGGIRFTTRANMDNLSGTVLQRGLFQPYNEVTLYNSAYTRDLNPPTKVLSTVDLKVSAVSLVTDTADITCSLRGWLES